MIKNKKDVNAKKETEKKDCKNIQDKNKKIITKSCLARNGKQEDSKHLVLGDFFANYEVKDKKSFGKNYYRRKRWIWLGLIIEKSFNFIYNNSLRLAGVILLIALALGLIPGVLSAPNSVFITAKDEWEAGMLTNIDTESTADAIQLKSDGTWNARTWAPTPDTISFGSSSVMVDNYLYVTRGYADKSFYRYDAGENKWDILADLPQATHYGCDLSYDGIGNIYFIFGGFSKEFYKYNIEDEEWTKLPDLLDTVYAGASIEFDGTDMFVTRGQSFSDFWRFDISENMWYGINPIPATLTSGSTMVYGENGYMYITRGSGTTTFYRYNIVANNWLATPAITASSVALTGEQKGVFYNGYIYFLVSNNTTTFLRYSIAGNSWTTLATAPQTNNLSSLTFNPADNLIYAIRGGATYNLWKFDPNSGATGTWVGPADLPGAVGTGGDFIWNKVTGAGAYVYALRGASNSFYRYDITANTWTTMGNAPTSFSYDTKGTYYNGNFYIPLGNNTTAFYIYNVAGNSWSTASTTGLGTLGYGSAAIYNSGDGYIYVTRGNATNTLYRYNIAGNSWTTMTGASIAGGASYQAYVGSRLESDGTNLYMMPGDGETAFLKYNVGANTWTELTPTSFAQNYGTDVSYFNGKIYALAGYYKDETWEYTIATNSWRLLPANQKYVYERGPYNGASLEYMGNNSFLATPGFGLVDVWSYTIGTNNYINSGSYISEEIDLAYVSSWISLTVNQNTPANTSIITETRTSSDGESWSNWETLSGVDIQSNENRYIQVKFTLGTTDGINTPTIYDYTISYNSEDNDPDNATTINASSQRIGGTAISSGVAYKHAHPYFTWNDAIDSGSGINGYWVYFGTNESADPETDGSYVTNPEYLVNTAMNNGNYYLRIKTKDNDGNVSDSAWGAFTYNYSGVSPYLTEEKTSEADFQAGVMDKISAKSDGSFRLNSISGFWNEKRLSYAPAGFRYGSRLAYVESSNKIYVLNGNNSTVFYSYDIATDVWSTLQPAPLTVYYGSFLVAGPAGYLYATRGADQSDFWRYNIVANTWESVSNASKVFTYGGSLQYDGSRYIYGLPGNDDAFYRYDTQNNVWSNLENAEFGNPNESDGQRVYEGSYTAYDNSDIIYALQGNNYPYFSKYSISTGHWSVLEKAPVGVYEGGTITYDPNTQAVYMLSGKYRQNFFKYDIASNAWTELPMIPSYVSQGGSLKVVGNYIYAIKGDGSIAFYKFNIDENSWEVPQKGFFGPSDIGGGSSFGFSYGTNIVKDQSNNIYIVRGSSDNTFGKYNYQTGEFTKLAKTPVGIYSGSAMVYNEDEGTIYLTPGAIRTTRTGSVNNYFLKYTITSNNWEIITTDRIPLQTGTGSTMTYDGSRYIYLTRGTTGSNNWWRYDTTAVAGSRWSALLPTILNWNQGDGSRILYKDGYIYSTRAQNQNTFWRYDVAAGTWLQRANTLATIGIGSSLSDGGDGYLYLTRGINTNTYYRYNITGNVWETVANFPGQVNIGGAGDSASNRIWSTVGNGTNSYPDGLYSYVVGSEANGTAFEKRGNYVSESIDLIAVYRWANLDINYSKPAGTSVNIYTRTSNNQTDWSAWDLVNNEKYFGANHYNYGIVSPANKYIQVKIDLFSGDQIFSPSVTDYKINYYQDTLAPSNPTTLSAYSASNKVTVITSGSWYAHSTPYFEWPADELTGGASDGVGGSGVAGYWVYFGTDVNANAFIDGSYQTTTNYTASDLIPGETYHLKIIAIDNAGMFGATSYDAFSYKLDNIAPTNPTETSVTPTGFTAIDNYSFLWNSNAVDSQSGIAKFQYRTDGDVADVWYDIFDTQTVSLSLPNENHPIGAYQSGKNKLYLRVVDNAGNASIPITQDYYFSASAPSPPNDLVASPEYSLSNFFSFSWNAPSSFVGESSKLKYYYSINTLPTAYNTVETGLTFAGPGPFATQKGPNHFYVVAKDEAGNIDYSLYASVEFAADTSSPGAPVNIQIFDTSDRGNEAYSAALKWVTPSGVDANNFAGYVIYRSVDNINFTQVAITSGTAYVDSDLESKLYYYYAKAKDLTNNLSIASTTVSLTPTGKYTSPPLLVGEPKFTVQSFAANFTWATNRIASSFVEYGKTISLGETNGQIDSVTDHTVDLKGLSAGTKYFYRVKYIDQDGNIGTSDISNFTTLPPPVISEVVVSEITLTSAIISWKTNSSAICSLKYGSSVIEETSSGANHIEKIEGLVASSSYSYEVNCVDGELNSFSSDQYSFSTPQEPLASNVTVENKDNVDLPTVVVNYDTNVETTTLVYFKSSDENEQHTFLLAEKTTTHQAELQGLDPAKEYTISVTGVDENGIYIKAIDQKITTRSDSRPPEIITNRAIGKTSGRGDNAQANMYIKIETDEATKVKVFYAEGIVVANFEQSTSEDASNTYHLVTIPVKAGQVYSYKVETYDEARNITTTETASVIVGNAKASATEVITGTFAERFGWLTKVWN